MTPVRTGLLASKLRVASLPSRRGSIRYGVTVGEGLFTGRTFYGAFVELGHKLGARWGYAKAAEAATGEKHRGLSAVMRSARASVPPHPYLRDALAETKAAGVAIIVESVRAAVESNQWLQLDR